MKKNEKNKVNQGQAMHDLKVVRLPLKMQTKAGDDMYAYLLREEVTVGGNVREIRVEFSVKKKDVAGYDMLDIIFMLADEAFLAVREEFMTDEKTGEVTPYTVYEIWNEDEDGIVYSYKVKPMRESDNAKLKVILQKRALAYERAQAEQGTAPVVSE